LLQDLAQELGVGGIKEEEEELLRLSRSDNRGEELPLFLRKKVEEKADVQLVWDTLQDSRQAEKTIFYNLVGAQLAILYVTKLRDPKAPIYSLPIPKKADLKILPFGQNRVEVAKPLLKSGAAKLPKQPRPDHAPLLKHVVCSKFARVVWNGSPNAIRRVKQALQTLEICGPGDEGKAEVLYHEFHDFVLMKGLFGPVWVFEQGFIEGAGRDAKGELTKYYLGKANSKLQPEFCKSLACPAGRGG